MGRSSSNRERYQISVLNSIRSNKAFAFTLFRKKISFPVIVFLAPGQFLFQKMWASDFPNFDLRGF